MRKYTLIFLFLTAQAFGAMVNLDADTVAIPELNLYPNTFAVPSTGPTKPLGENWFLYAIANSVVSSINVSATFGTPTINDYGLSYPVGFVGRQVNEVVVVPEPATVLILGFGFLIITVSRTKVSKK